MPRLSVGSPLSALSRRMEGSLSGAQRRMTSCWPAPNGHDRPMSEIKMHLSGDRFGFLSELDGCLKISDDRQGSTDCANLSRVSSLHINAPAPGPYKMVLDHRRNELK